MRAPVRENHRTGARSCRWCHRELEGDCAELVHSICGPHVEQVDALRDDMLTLRSCLSTFALCLIVHAGFLGTVLYGATQKSLALWQACVVMVTLVGTLLWLRWLVDEQLRITRGLWRRVRWWESDAQKARERS